MSAKKRPYRNPQMDLFIEKAMDNIAPGSLNLLDAEDRQHIVGYRRWLRFGTFEEKLVMLTKLGYSYAVVVAAKEERLDRNFLDRVIKIFFRCLTFKKRDATKFTQGHQWFFLADRDVVKGLKLAGNLVKEAPQKQTQERAVDNAILRAMKLREVKSERTKFEMLYRISYAHYYVLAMLQKRQSLGARYKARLVELMHEKMVECKPIRSQERNGMTYWLTGYGELVLQKARKYFTE